MDIITSDFIPDGLVLDEFTRLYGFTKNKMHFSLHKVKNLAIVTDYFDYSIIYSIQSWDFFCMMDKK